MSSNLEPYIKDLDKFDEVLDTFYSSLCFFAEQLVGDRDISASIVVVEFKNLWLFRDRFMSILNIKAFLFLSVRNSCFNCLRSGKSGKWAMDHLKLNWDQLIELSERFRIKALVVQNIFLEENKKN